VLTRSAHGDMSNGHEVQLERWKQSAVTMNKGHGQGIRKAHGTSNCYMYLIRQ